MIAVMVGMIAVLAVGAYLFIRLIASVLNSRRDKWESAAGDLGLSVDTVGGIQKSLNGEFEGRKVKISHYGVQKTENSADDHAAVEFEIDTSLPFSFRIERLEMFYQKVADMFSSDETGHEPFDQSFKVETSNVEELVRLLNLDVPGGETSTFLNDLMITQKNYFRVIVTDTSVCLGRKTDLGDTETIRRTLKRAAYLTARLEEAASAYVAK